jgi:hypothetical protein
LILGADASVAGLISTGATPTDAAISAELFTNAFDLNNRSLFKFFAFG